MKKFYIKLLSAAVAALMLVTPMLEGCLSQADKSEPTGGDTGTVGGSTAPGTTVDGDPKDPEVVYESDPALAVSEICVQNEYAAASSDGGHYPWIEFFANARLELSDYSLSVSGGEPLPLPQKELDSGEYYLLFLEGDYAIENISASAEVVLRHGDAISQKFIYINRTPNCSYLVSGGSECATPTPGYENALPAGEIVISEIMADNTKYPISGVLCDYVELHNISDHPVVLSDYFLSDDAAKPYANRLEAQTLEAGGYYVFACGEDTFGISKNGETVVLTRKDGVTVSSLTFEALDKNSSFTPDGVSELPSPGYPDTKEGWAAAICARRGLVISEVLASNVSAYKAEGGYFDAIELYNDSEEAIGLSDYFITDKLSDPERYRLPEGTLAPHSYFVLLFTKAEGAPGFGISSSGESLKITRSDGYITDVLTYPALRADISYGRSGNSLVYFETSTIGKANGRGYDSISQAPAASLASGVYDSAVSVKLSGDGNIYYTTDGTKPTEKSKLYSGETITLSHTGTIRTICKKGDLIVSSESSFSYMIEDRDYTLPCVMLSLKDSEMFGTNGIWTRNTHTDAGYISDRSEIEGRITFIEDGEEKFSVGCGFRIFGGMTRYYVKKSIAIKFRAKYGASTLDYKLFDDSDLDSFNSLVLRAGGQSLLNAVIKDEYISSLARTGGDMPSVLMQNYRPVDLFINGEYFGVYFLKEKIDEHFVAAHEGCDPDSVTIIDHMGTIKDGSSDLGWSALWKFIKNNDLTVKENYDYVCSQFDIESLADHYILQIWAQNTDTGNVRIYRSSEEGSKWKFILYDLDLSFNVTSSETGASVYLGKYVSSGKPYNPLIIKMLKNDEFREFFYSRMDLHLRGALSSERAVAFLEEMRSTLEHDMEYEIARWKDQNSRYNQSLKAWNTRIANISKRVGGNYSEQTYADIDEAIKKILQMKI